MRGRQSNSISTIGSNAVRLSNSKSIDDCVDDKLVVSSLRCYGDVNRNDAAKKELNWELGEKIGPHYQKIIMKNTLLDKSYCAGKVRRLFWACMLSFVGSMPVVATPVPPTDNTSAPYLGFYEWGLTSGPCQSRLAWWDTAMNRSNLWTQDFTNDDSWADMEGNSYMFGIAANYLRDNPGATYMIAVGLLPGSGNTPLSGTSLANGAAGNYNSYFAAMAQNLVNAGIANRTIVRLGHEFNGNWYPWAVTSDAQALNYAAYWKQVVTAVHAVPGASGIKFCWCGAATVWTSYNIADAYPGNAYVDYVAADIYDRCYDTDTYPYPNGDSQADILQRQKNAWADNVATLNNGLQAWDNIANTNSKPFAIPEWGTWNTSSNGGGDDPYYIQQMYNYIQNPANNVAWHMYFDVWASDGNHQLSTAPSEGPTAFPNSAALFTQLFAVPPFTTNNDIGTTGLTGACNAFSTTGAGGGFLSGGTSDNFHFASEAAAGSTMCLAQITSMSTSTGQAGLMIRQSAAANDIYAALFVSNGNLIFQSRTTAGAAAVTNATVGSVALPVWLKLLQTGNVISGYQSTDGMNWTYVASQTVTMTSSAYAGVAVSSGNTTTLNTVGTASVNNPDIQATLYSSSGESMRIPPIPSAIIVDSASSGVTKTGSWGLSGTQQNLYGGSMLTAWTPTTLSTITFTPNLPVAGQYDVYFTTPGNYQDGDETPISITSTSGTTSGTFNEQTCDGLWTYVGTYSFNAGTTGNLKLTNASVGGYGYVAADAAMFVPVPVAPIAQSVSGGTGVTVTGTWSQSTVITPYYGNYYLWTSGTSGDSVQFTPNLPAAGAYQVYAWWTAYTNRATNAPFSIVNAKGTASVTENQQINGGQWISLGIYSFNAGTGGSVTVSDTGANGNVIANAVEFVPAAPIILSASSTSGVTTTGTWTQSTATEGYYGNYYLVNSLDDSSTVTFTPTLTSTGTYQVYAMWTAGTNRATNTPITVVSASGAASMNVNQQTNGGQWYSLGTYTFNAGTGGSITVGATGANGVVIANAVKLVPSP